jgi:AcrR family transcriptional regulator
VPHRDALQLALLENEERIVRAAHQLSVRDGYRATTLAAVADAAGVAHRTVYVRFGTKAALLKRVVDVATVGDLAPIDVVSREWYQTATSAPTLDARIAAFAEGGARLVTSAADVVAVAREAEPAEPLLAEQASAGRAATRQALEGFWMRARDDGLLQLQHRPGHVAPAPPECDLTWLTETSCLLSHIDTYLLMRQMQPAAAKRYQTWLATTYHRLVTAAAQR